MLIDTSATTKAPANSPSNPVPELQELLADLKLTLGQKLDALVVKTQIISAGDRQLLIEARPATNNPAQRLTQTLLQDPALKLVEIKLFNQTQQPSLPTLTNLPIVEGAKIQVLITARGLVILPVSAEVTAPQVQTTTSQTGMPKPTAPVLPPNPIVPQTTSPTLSTPTLTATPLGSPPVQSNPSATPTGRPGLGGSNTPETSIKNAPVASLLVQLRNTERANTPNTATRTVTLMPGLPLALAGARANITNDPAATQTLLATALARALPEAERLPALLHAADKTSQLLLKQGATLPPVLQQFRSLLHQLQPASLDLSKFNPLQPAPLQTAMRQSGVFYERLQLRPEQSSTATADRQTTAQDIKGALIHLQQWLSQASTPPAIGKSVSPDGFSQLWSSLIQIFSPKYRTQGERASMAKLAQAALPLVEKSLAQVQMQQYRSVSAQTLDPAGTNHVHLDIPLKLPDGYGNLYLQLYEPRVNHREKEERSKKDQPNRHKARWRVFMELTLGEMGALSAEISVCDRQMEATLWVEQDELRSRAAAHLRQLKQDLENQGLEVTDLRCSNLQPPNQKVTMDFALIDIKT